MCHSVLLFCVLRYRYLVHSDEMCVWVCFIHAYVYCLGLELVVLCIGDGEIGVHSMGVGLAFMVILRLVAM